RSGGKVRSIFVRPVDQSERDDAARDYFLFARCPLCLRNTLGFRVPRSLVLGLVGPSASVRFLRKAVELYVAKQRRAPTRLLMIVLVDRCATFAFLQSNRVGDARRPLQYVNV